LITVTAESCSDGFVLSVVDPSNSDLAQYTGRFQVGPCKHIDDDQPDWFHLIDQRKRRIVRIRRAQSTSAFELQTESNPWCLCVWNHPSNETIVLQSEGSSSIDAVKFAGLALKPIVLIKGVNENARKVALRKDSVKLMYFGGMCRLCLRVILHERSYFVNTYLFSLLQLQYPSCRRRVVPVLPPLHQETQDVF
jgi:hypothetical protein